MVPHRRALLTADGACDGAHRLAIPDSGIGLAPVRWVRRVGAATRVADARLPASCACSFLKLIRLLKAAKIFKVMEEELDVNMSVLKLFKLVFIAVFLGHLIACFVFRQ